MNNHPITVINFLSGQQEIPVVVQQPIHTEQKTIGFGWDENFIAINQSLNPLILVRDPINRNNMRYRASNISENKWRLVEEWFMIGQHTNPDLLRLQEYISRALNETEASSQRELFQYFLGKVAQKVS